MPATKVKRSTARRSAKGTAKHNGKRTATRKRLVTPEDLTRFIGVSDPQISPDGDRVVFVRSHLDDKGKKRTSLWMAPAAGAAPSAFTNGESDSHPRWSPDGRTIAFAGKRDGAAAQLYVIPAGGGEARKLTSFPEGSIGGFRWSPDGRRLAVRFRETDPEWTEAAKNERDENGHGEPPRVIDDWWYRLDGDGYFNAQRYRLHLVDADSGAHDLVYKGDTLGFFEFDFSPDGKHLAITTIRDKKALIRPWKAEILILDVASGKTRPVPGLPAGPKDAVRWSPDGKWLAYAGRVGEDDTYSTENLELFVCDPRRGKTRSLTGDTDYCLMAVASTDTAEIDFGAAIQWAPDAKRVYMKLGWHGESHVASVPVKGGAVTVHTTGPYDHGMGNVSADGRRMALTRSSVSSLPEVYLGAFQRSRLEATALSALNAPLLRELKLAKATTRWVQSEDGTPVQVWTMLPPDHKSGSTKKYPAVLEIHGGPHAMYGVGFFHEFQVLAAKGHAVFYSNPRGSKGYGRDHCAAIRGAWGTADWVDVQAVTALMKKHPNVRADRMGIMGGSYGGYMTNWAIGHTRDFAGAITDRCVSNVVTMGGTSDFVDEPDRYFPGNFWDRPEARWEQSPIRYIGNAKTPTLIIHSEGDLRCNIEQAEQVFVALKLLGVPTRLVRYPRTTSHGMSRMGPANLRIHRLDQILEWWGKYL